ncbi:hypothetical protein [Psychroflexus aestuariivivens]|uniref:hypothetical protein n=1 Tax=Psychroflexus aestuariivivens TaxID=1795040 RepID=UPI000FDB686C|nr:hypothetical protein [Psychroflexus aestuariivivens]
MKFIISLTLLLFVFTNLNAQDTNWSTSFDIGFANANGSFTPNYSASELNNLTGSFGVRYMFDSRRYYLRPYGIELKGGFTNLSGDSGSEPFETSVYHITLNGVIDVQDAFKIDDRDWPYGLNLYTNLGVGAAHYTFSGDAVYSDISDGYILDGDDLITLNLGITPEFQVSRELAISLNFTYSMFASPDFTFDGNQSVQNAGVSDFDPTMFRATFGITYYIFSGYR